MKRYLLILVAVASLIAGCSKIDLDEIGKHGVGTSLATPVGTIDVTIFDLYSKFDTLIELQYNEDNTIFLSWEQPITIEEFNIKDFTEGSKLTGSYKLTDYINVPGLPKRRPNGRRSVDILIQDTLKYNFNFNENNDTNIYLIDSIKIRSAELGLTVDIEGITLDENNYLEVTLEFPTLVASKPVVINAHAASNNLDIDRQLGSFMAKFGNDSTSSIDMYLTFRLVTDGSTPITSNAAINYSAQIKDINYDIIYGYVFSSKPICSNHTTVELGNTDQLYEFMEKNFVSLYDPEFIIELTTNLGVDAALNLHEISAYTRTGNVTSAMFGGEKSFTKVIDRAMEPGESATSTIRLNRSYGQMNKLFEEIPDSLVLDWDLYIGSLSETHNNFIVDPIELDANFAVRLPIWFDKGTYINYEDTLDADLTEINGEWTDYVDMQRFEIFLDFQNTLPVHAYATLEFMDSDDNTLFEAKEIELACPPVDELGRSTGVAEREETLLFTDEEIAVILKTKKIALHCLVDGYDKESAINFHSTDGLRVKISAYATAAISTSKKEK